MNETREFVLERPGVGMTADGSCATANVILAHVHRATKAEVVMHHDFLCRLVAACWLFGIAMGSGKIAAQQVIQVTKEQLVGTWKLVSWEQFEPDGSTSPASAGTNIAGSTNGRGQTKNKASRPRQAVVH